MPLPTDRLAAAFAVVLGFLAGTAAAQEPGSAESPVQIGDAYSIEGQDYRPVDGPLDEVGYAGLAAAKGGSTGETTIHAAHRTLPLPSYAEVTALATGRTILVRVDGRGPMVRDRVIDLSCGAIRQLGLGAVPAAVRARRVNPPEQERAALRAGQKAAERMESPEGLLSALRRQLPPAPRAATAGDCALRPIVSDPGTDAAVHQPQGAPPPAESKAEPKTSKPPVAAPVATAPKPAPAATGPGYDIQVAALTNRARAASLARRIGGRVEVAGALLRVRTGPYPTEAAARAALPQIRAKGFADAHVVTNGGR